MDRLVFQALDWQEKTTDGEPDSSESEEYDEDTEKQLPKKRLLVVVYGRCVDNSVVRVTLENFKPSLLLKMSKKKAQAAVNLSGMNIADVEFGTTRLKDFVNFDFEDKVFTVLRFNNPMEFAGARRKLKDLGLELYNCRVQPFMQLIHRAGVSPGGWVSVPVPRQTDKAKLIDVTCDWKSLSHVPDPPAPMAPFVVTSFDIECYSKSGDFPAAKKGYNRFARDIIKFIEDHDSEPDLMNRLEDAVISAFDGREHDGIAELELMDGHTVPSIRTLRQSFLSDLGESINSTKWRATSSTIRTTNLAAKLDCLTERGQRDALRTAAEACGSAVARNLMYNCSPDVCQERGFAAGKEASPFASAPIISEIAKAALKGGTSAYNVSKHASDLDEQVSNRAKRWAATAAESAVMPWAKQPLPLLKGDPVIQVGLTTRRGRDGELEKLILVLGGCDDIPGTTVIRYEDEISLLKGTAQYFKDVDPDFITGYNIMGFDYQYIYHRAEELKVLDAMEMGRFSETDDMPDRNRYNPMFLEKRMVSAAYGDNTMRYFDMPGRVQFDLMKVVQREHSLPSYKLDAVARHFTGDCKDGLSPADIFRMHMGTDGDRASVAAYCVQDCALCSDLVNKLNTLPNAIGMADVCLVPVSWIFLKGQGCKILSLVSKQCRIDGFAIPELRNPTAEGYDGAHVLPPRIGVYIETPVAVLDFSSLYPSSMISANLSHDTMLADDQDAPEGCTIEPVTFNLYPKTGGTKEVTRRYVQPGGKGREGVLPRILKTLLSQRAAVRKRIPSEPDAFARSVLDGLQQAFKVTANSLYGQLGSATSDICCVDIAASTTAVGRQMLLKLRDYVTQKAQGDVIYGDSVAGYTPVFVLFGGRVLLDTVENIASTLGFDKWVPCIDVGRQDKEALEFSDLQIWSDDGWTPVRRLIRHRLAPHKRMLRITTATGVVDVTDDHSLLRPDKSAVKPTSLKAGELLLHADIPDMPIEELCKVPEGFQIDAARAFALSIMSGHKPSVHTNGDTINFGTDPEDSDIIQRIDYLADYGDRFVYDFTTDNHHFAAGVGRIVVHNTDSCFMTFPKACAGLKGLDAVAATIAEGKKCSSEFRKFLPPPQDAEYEKTFWPMILISKKRYVGNMFENDAFAKPKQKSMGLVLKRRDNAPVVKRVYGESIDMILNKGDIGEAASFVKNAMLDLVGGHVDVSELIVSKSLRTGYANPDQIAHAVLAKRMAERDPGSAPAVGDRVPYVYVSPIKGEFPQGTLQGNRIEHPDHIDTSTLCIDYSHYVTNQVMKPVSQLFALMVDRIPGCRLTPEQLEIEYTMALNASGGDADKARKKLDVLKQSEVIRLMFQESLDIAKRKKSGMADITSFIKLC